MNQTTRRRKDPIFEGLLSLDVLPPFLVPFQDFMSVMTGLIPSQYDYYVPSVDLSNPCLDTNVSVVRSLFFE